MGFFRNRKLFKISIITLFSAVCFSGCKMNANDEIWNKNASVYGAESVEGNNEGLSEKTNDEAFVFKGASISSDSPDYELIKEYDPDSKLTGFVEDYNSAMAMLMYDDVISCTNNYSEGISSDTVNSFYAPSEFLFNITDNEPVFAKQIYKRLYPASTTKLLTAYVTLKNNLLDEQVTISEDNGGIDRYGAQLCGFKTGDVIDMKSLLGAMLIYSGNDAASEIARFTAGKINGTATVDSFVGEMNKEIKLLGGLRSAFLNPHGLHEDNHYTCAYDMYLILNACNKIEGFDEIVKKSSITVNFKDSEGNAKELTFDNTNKMLSGEESVPAGVTIIGGKTGSTPYAGSCLIQMFEKSGKRYIVGVFGASSGDALYNEMRKLMDLAK